MHGFPLLLGKNDSKAQVSLQALKKNMSISQQKEGEKFMAQFQKDLMKKPKNNLIY